MRIFGLNKMTLSELSVTERIDAPGCMIVLNPTAPRSLNLNGTSDVSAKNCMVQVNSSSPTALAEVGSATLTAQAICLVGGYSGTNFSPEPQVCQPVKDPLAASFAADLATFNTSVCDQYNGNGKPLTLPTGTVNLSPGVYCGGIKVTNNSTASLASGVYFIKDGEFDVRSGGTVRGAGVTIVLIGNSDTDLNVQSGGNLQIKAPASGRFAGIAIAHDPASIPSSSKGDLIIGGGSVEVEGIIYTPRQVLTITGNGDISMNVKQFALIADMLSIEGNGLLRIGEAADATGSGLPILPAWLNQVRLLPDSSFVES